MSRNAEVIAVGPNGAGEFGRYWRSERIPFIGIPDPGHKLARLYRQEVKLFRLGRMPLVIIVDGKGLIQFVHRGESMADIPENDVMLEVLDCIQSGIPNPSKPELLDYSPGGDAGHGSGRV